MRITISILILSLFVAYGCYGSRAETDDDLDGGPILSLESGASDSSDSHSVHARQDVRPWAMDSGIEGGRTAVCGNNIQEEGEICDGPDPSCEIWDDDPYCMFYCSADCQNFGGYPIDDYPRSEIDAGGLVGPDEDDSGV
jgi:hypothetical protein